MGNRTLWRFGAMTMTAVAVCCVLSIAPVDGQQRAGGTHDFTGAVESVDPGAHTVTVNGDNVAGWMAAMTMAFRVDRPEVLGQLK
ncbi:MAG TPA: copper-binding protein, partial [Vicinamibacterales bacterium]